MVGGWIAKSVGFPNGLFGFWLLEFYVLATYMVKSGWAENHDLISHSVTLFRYWAKKSLPHSNNAEHLTRKRQVSILYVIGLTQPGFKPVRSKSSNLPKRRWILNSFGHPIWSSHVEDWVSENMAESKQWLTKFNQSNDLLNWYNWSTDFKKASGVED